VLKDSPRDNAVDNQFKSTNIKTFISKNQEETIVNSQLIKKNKTIDNHQMVRKMTRFDDKLSIILDNSKNNSFFSNNKNNISVSNKSLKLEKNDGIINKSFRSLNENKELNKKISRIEEKMSKIKKNGSFDTIILNNLSGNKSQLKEKIGSSGSIISKTLKQNTEKNSSDTPLTDTNKLIRKLNQHNVIETKQQSKPVIVRVEPNSYFNSLKESYLVSNNFTKNQSNVIPNISGRNSLHPSREPKISLPNTDKTILHKSVKNTASQQRVTDSSHRVNLDSRVNSQNDISKFKDSDIVNRNSFLSQNF
jgi:hypothetical protein